MKSAGTGGRESGVTMVELMIVIVIAAILAAIAAPSFGDFINRTRQSSVSSQLYADLSRARSEAIKRNARVLVCLRDTDSECNDSGATNWSNGWLVCLDADSDDECDDGTVDNPNPISVHAALDTKLTLTGPGAPVRFNSSGISGSGVATFTVGGTWSGATASKINLAVTGNLSRQ